MPCNLEALSRSNASLFKDTMSHVTLTDSQGLLVCENEGTQMYFRGDGRTSRFHCLGDPGLFVGLVGANLLLNGLKLHGRAAN